MLIPLVKNIILCFRVPPDDLVHDCNNNYWVTADPDKWDLADAINGVLWFQQIKPNRFGFWTLQHSWLKTTRHHNLTPVTKLPNVSCNFFAFERLKWHHKTIAGQQHRKRLGRVQANWLGEWCDVPSAMWDTHNG